MAKQFTPIPKELQQQGRITTLLRWNASAIWPCRLSREEVIRRSVAGLRPAAPFVRRKNDLLCALSPDQEPYAHYAYVERRYDPRFVGRLFDALDVEWEQERTATLARLAAEHKCQKRIWPDGELYMTWCGERHPEREARYCEGDWLCQEHGGYYDAWQPPRRPPEQILRAGLPPPRRRTDRAIPKP